MTTALEIGHENALTPGTVLEEYRIEGILGHGGFGITYLARDLHLNRPAAIKEYLPQELAVRRTNGSVVAKSGSDRDTYGWGLERFMEEAQTLARFSHQNIAKVHRCFSARGTAYIVMEYEVGETLALRLARLPKGGRMSENVVLEWLEPALDGLQAVHAHGLLHRDLKPENIYLRTNGPAMLIDFGAARYALGSRSKSLSVVLTPGYAPNEQYARQGKQGPWTDIYSLGAVLYRCITGLEPLDAPERATAIIEGRRDPLPRAMELEHGHGYSSGLLNATDRAMAFSARERPAGVAAFRDVLKGKAEPRRPMDMKVDSLSTSGRATVEFPCPECGKLNDDQSRYCHACGTNLPSPIAARKDPASQPLPSLDTVVYAGFWKRFLAAFIDSVVILGVFFMVFLLFDFLEGALGGENEVFIARLCTLFSGILGWIYYAVMESSAKQATFGKIALGLTVTDGTGNRISFGRATGRHVGKTLSFLILGVGFAMAGFTKRKQTLHDMMADCLIIRGRQE